MNWIGPDNLGLIPERADYTFISPEAEKELKATRSGPLTAGEIMLLRSISGSVLEGDTSFEKPNLTPFEQRSYRHTIADYLNWQDRQIGAKLAQRAGEIFGPGGEARPAAATQWVTSPVPGSFKTASVTTVVVLLAIGAVLLALKSGRRHHDQR